MTTPKRPESPVLPVDDFLHWIHPFFEGPSFEARRANTHIKLRDRFKAEVVEIPPEGPPQKTEEIDRKIKVSYYPRVVVLGTAKSDPLLTKVVVFTLLYGPYEDREMFERVFHAEVEFLKKDKNRPEGMDVVVGAWYENKLTFFKLQDGKMIVLEMGGVQAFDISVDIYRRDEYNRLLMGIFFLIKENFQEATRKKLEDMQSASGEGSQSVVEDVPVKDVEAIKSSFKEVFKKGLS